MQLFIEQLPLFATQTLPKIYSTNEHMPAIIVIRFCIAFIMNVMKLYFISVSILGET